MHNNSMKLMADFRDEYLSETKGCTVLDIGAMQVKKQKHSYREIFEPDYKYTGMDLSPGLNVDVVGFKGITKMYDVVISGQVMEHVNRPWEWLKSLKPHFRKYICIIAPNGFKEHRYPIDTYRYFPDGMKDLFDYAEIIPINIYKSDKDTVGIGIKTDGSQTILSSRLSTLARLLRRYHGVEKFCPAPIRIQNFYRTKIPKVINRLGLKKGAEIGVKKGIYSEALCQRIPDIDLLCIDNWGEEDSEECYELAKERLRLYNVTFIEKTSMEAVKDIPKESLGFIYIDANHNFDPFMEDLIEWGERVQPGGIIAGHDYQLQGVKDAVDAYTKAHNIKEWFLSSNHWPSFFWRK